MGEVQVLDYESRGAFEQEGVGFGRLVVKILVHQAVVNRWLVGRLGIIDVEAADDIAPCHIGIVSALGSRASLSSKLGPGARHSPRLDR